MEMQCVYVPGYLDQDRPSGNESFYLITVVFCFLAAYIYMHVCMCLGVCLFAHIFIDTGTSHTCTHMYIFSFKTKPEVSQKVRLARDRKSMAFFWRMGVRLCILNFRTVSVCILLKSNLGHLPDAWNGLNQESLKICPRINQLWKHYLQRWMTFSSSCDLVPGLLISFSKLRFCIQLWIICNRYSFVCCYLFIYWRRVSGTFPAVPECWSDGKMPSEDGNVTWK